LKASAVALLALKSGVMAGDAVNQALTDGDFDPRRFGSYAATLRRSVENMRKLIYAFYNPQFSFRQLTDRYPDLAGAVTDCLSGDVNKDFSELWSAIREFAELPEALPYGEPLAPATVPATP